MATVSNADVILRAARELKIITHGQALAKRYQDTLDTAFQDALAELRRQQIAYWGAEETPPYAAEPLAKFIAGRVASQFYSDGQSLNDMLSKGADGERRLRALVAKRQPSDKIVHSDYF